MRKALQVDGRLVTAKLKGTNLDHVFSIVERVGNNAFVHGADLRQAGAQRSEDSLGSNTLASEPLQLPFNVIV